MQYIEGINNCATEKIKKDIDRDFAMCRLLANHGKQIVDKQFRVGNVIVNIKDYRFRDDTFRIVFVDNVPVSLSVILEEDINEYDD